MRLFPTLMGFKQKARPMPKEPVAFREILPLKLKAGVSGKGGKVTSACCLYEMSVLFSCLSSSEFQQQPCSSEIASFQKCYKTYSEDKKAKSDREMRGLLTPGERNLTAKQLNILLKKYPHS